VADSPLGVTHHGDHPRRTVRNSGKSIRAGRRHADVAAAVCVLPELRTEPAPNGPPPNSPPKPASVCLAGIRWITKDFVIGRKY
jgi:hypothetical protein